MIRIWSRIAVYTVVFVLLQVLVMNNIHLFGIVTPFIYLYVILKLPVDLSRSRVILVSFLLGLTIDIFSNTFGIHAAACSFIGLIRAPIIERFVDMRELQEGSVPSYNAFGYIKFMRYALIIIAIHHVALFTIEAFSFFQPGAMIVRMMSSILLSTMLIFVIEAFNLGKAKSGE